LRRLREKFPDELVVIGVHSAKFPSERLTENIRQAVLRHDIHHPVINDAGFQVWKQYAVRAWPTVAIVDPAGNYAGSQAGEITAEEMAPLIAQLIDEFDDEGLINSEPLDLRAEAAFEPQRLLSFPSKLLLASDGDAPVADPATVEGGTGRLYVADTGHHRILEIRLDESGLSGEIVRAFGSGRAGLQDGPADSAEFHGPHGLAYVGTADVEPPGSGVSLYVADTDNHAIRAIDLASGAVRTVAGTGIKAHGQFSLGKPTETPLRSPWALIPIGDELLLIAMAGTHQIWALVNETQIGPFAGNGREALEDGPRGEASFNQPSDLALGLGHLLVADAEASAIRAISLDEAPRVITLVGQGLFEFGDVDGTGSQARLQHPTGLAYHDGAIYIADSYNHKIKRLDPTTGLVETLIGTGEAGLADGPFKRAGLFEPEGVAAAEGRLYIADTNNHLIRVADLAAGRLHTLDLRGIERLASPAVEEPAPVYLPPVTVAPGRVTLTLNVELPPGYKFNPEAPLIVRLPDEADGAVHTFEAGTLPALALEIDSDRDLALDLTVYYCEAADARLCLIDTAQLVLPVLVAAGGRTEATVAYAIEAGE
jgi:hypothetical protein